MVLGTAPQNKIKLCRQEKIAADAFQGTWCLECGCGAVAGPHPGSPPASSIAADCCGAVVWHSAVSALISGWEADSQSKSLFNIWFSLFSLLHNCSSQFSVENLHIWPNLKWSSQDIRSGRGDAPPRLRDIRSICVISASYYPFIGLWWAHMKFQSEIYGFWKIEKITFFQGSPLWKLFGTSKNANFQCIYKICCSFVILWDTDIPNMSN